MLNLALPTMQNIVTCNVLLNCDGCKYTYSLIYLATNYNDVGKTICFNVIHVPSHFLANEDVTPYKVIHCRNQARPRPL